MTPVSGYQFRQSIKKCAHYLATTFRAGIVDVKHQLYDVNNAIRKAPRVLVRCVWVGAIIMFLYALSVATSSVMELWEIALVLTLQGWVALLFGWSCMHYQQLSAKLFQLTSLNKIINNKH